MGRLWEGEVRERFPVTQSWTYLNTATAGPVPLETARAGAGVYQSMLAHGDGEWQQMLLGLDEARRQLAAITGCHPEELAFTRNTSHSASLAAQMLWDAGHRQAVALEDEFPASTIPFLSRGFDLRFVRAVDGQYKDEDITDALKGRTVLIASQVMYRTGTVLDPVRLGRLAAGAGAGLVLCVTQALGALTVDFHASGAAFLLGTSHKWLCGGYGAGFLGMRKDLIGRLHWPAAGWLSQRHPDRMLNSALDFPAGAKVLEMGCASFAPILALGESLRFWNECGPDSIQRRVRLLTRLLREKLREADFAIPERPAEELSGITIVPMDHAERVSEALLRQRIAQAPRGAGIRLAVHAFNNEEDLDRAVEALRAQRTRPG